MKIQILDESIKNKGKGTYRVYNSIEFSVDEDDGEYWVNMEDTRRWGWDLMSPIFNSWNEADKFAKTSAVELNGYLEDSGYNEKADPDDLRDVIDSAFSDIKILRKYENPY